MHACSIASQGSLCVLVEFAPLMALLARRRNDGLGLWLESAGLFSRGVFLEQTFLGGVLSGVDLAFVFLVVFPGLVPSV
jgi:hypothetical protein